MSYTNWPNLITSGGVPVMGVGGFIPPNQVFWVGSASGGVNGSGYGLRPTRPYASVHYAFTKCEANAGDFIICLPGHVETISAAAACVMDKAGVTVLCLGNGDDRAQFNFTTAVGADLDVDAAGVSIINARFTGGFDNVTAMLDVNASDFSLINCSYRDVTGQVAKFLQGDANADNLKIVGLDYFGAAAAGTTVPINLNGSAGFLMKDSRLIANASTALIEVATVAASDIQIYDCFLQTLNAADVIFKDTITGSTGILGPRLYCALTDDAANIDESFVSSAMRYFDPIYINNAVEERGLQLTRAVSADA